MFPEWMWYILGIGAFSIIFWGYYFIYTHGGFEAIARKITGVRMTLQRDPNISTVRRGIFLTRGKDILGGWHQPEWEGNPDVVFEIAWAVCLAFRGFGGLRELNEITRDGWLRKMRSGVCRSHVENFHRCKVWWENDGITITDWESYLVKRIYVHFPKQRWIEDPAVVYELFGSLVLAITDMKKFTERHWDEIREEQRAADLELSVSICENPQHFSARDKAKQAEAITTLKFCIATSLGTVAFWLIVMGMGWI